MFVVQAAGTNRVTLALLTAASFLMGAACSSAAGYAGAPWVLVCLPAASFAHALLQGASGVS